MDAQCLAAAELAASHFMKYLLIFKIFICFCGPLLLYWNIKTSGTVWLVHPNAILIYRAHLAFTLWVSIFFFVVHCIDLHRLTMAHSDPCDYRISIALSLNLRIIVVIGIYGQILTMLALSIERCAATVRPRAYERLRSNWLARILVCVGTLFSIVFCYTMLIPGVDWSKYNVGFLIKTTDNADRFQTVIWFEMVPEVISLCLFHIIVFLNSPLRDRAACGVVQLDLASRYQIEENRKICRLLLPVFYTHFVIFFLTSFGISLFPWVLPSGGEAAFAMFLEGVAWSPLYACAMPIIVHIRAYYRSRELARVALMGQNSYFQPITELAEMGIDRRRATLWKS